MNSRQAMMQQRQRQAMQMQMPVHPQPQAPAQPDSPAPKPKSRAKKGPDPITAEDAPVLTMEQRNLIRRYIELDNEIDELNAQLRQKRADRKQLESSVTSIIRPLPAPVRSGQTVLRVKKVTKKEGINQNFWTRKLAESGELKDASKADALVKNIYKNRAATSENYELVSEKKKP